MYRIATDCWIFFWTVPSFASIEDVSNSSASMMMRCAKSFGNESSFAEKRLLWLSNLRSGWASCVFLFCDSMHAVAMMSKNLRNQIRSICEIKTMNLVRVDGVQKDFEAKHWTVE